MNHTIQPKTEVVIILVTLTASALLLAQGVSAYVAGKLATPAHAMKRIDAPPQSPLGADPPDACAILARNIFDSASGALCPASTSVRIELPPTPRAPLPGEVLPACEGETRKLVVALYSERDASRSAVAMTSTPNSSQLFHEGDRVDDNVVFAIHPTAVHFKQDDGQYCSLAMFDEPVANRTSQSSIAHDGGFGIAALAENSFTAPRALVDELLKNPGAVSSSIRVVPYSKDGRTIGIKLYGIRINSVLHDLGLQNGDALLAINGLELASADAALDAYARLRTASKLAVSLERRGQAMTIAYAIE